MTHEQEKKWREEFMMYFPEIIKKGLSGQAVLDDVYLAARQKAQVEIDKVNWQRSLTIKANDNQIKMIEDRDQEIEKLKKEIQVMKDQYELTTLWEALKEIVRMKEQLSRRDELIREAIEYIDNKSRNNHYSLKYKEKEIWTEKARALLDGKPVESEGEIK